MEVVPVTCGQAFPTRPTASSAPGRTYGGGRGDGAFGGTGMSGWRKCDTCRKVKPTDDFDGDAPTCRACLTTPTPAPRKRTSTVTTRATAPRPPAAPVERGPRLGSVGSGDLEVRERRARRAASDALAELHPEEFALLLRNARAAEGLRPMAPEPPRPATEDS